MNVIIIPEIDNICTLFSTYTRLTKVSLPLFPWQNIESIAMKGSSQFQHDNERGQDNNLRILTSKAGGYDVFRQAPPLKKLKQHFDEYIKKHLQMVFDKVDDTFFDLADQADNNSEQGIYFYAMRTIRMERRALEQHTLTYVDAAFRRLGDENWQGDSRGNVGEPSLEIVEDDELEEIIALDNMVSKGLVVCKAELEQLNARINFLVPATVTNRNNPCSPTVVCAALGRGLENLKIDIRAKLVLLKLFDRHIVAELPGFQLEGNQQLKEMGVLPNLKLTIPQQGGKSAQAKRPPRQAIDSVANYERLMKLFGGMFAGVEASSLATPPPGQATFEHILSSLTVLQNRLSKIEDAAMGKLNLSRIMEQQVQLGGKASAGLGAVDKGIIQLVDQLIDSYGQRTTFPQQVSNQVQKLKVPILRIALEDPSFFERDDHPVRQLLNQLAELSVGLEDAPATNTDPVYEHIHGLISELAALESVDRSALTELTAEFTEKVKKSMRRVTALEKRLVEQVAANVQNNQAHREVNDALAELMAGKKLPRSVIDLVEQAWCKVLFLALMRHGKSSDHWTVQLHIIKSLIDLVEAREKDREEVEEVLGNIRHSLEDIAIDPYQLGNLLGGLEQFFEGQVFEDQGQLGGEPRGGYTENAKPGQEQVMVEQLATQLPGEIESEEEDLQTIEEEDLQRADSLTRGCWIDLVKQNMQGGVEKTSKERCKLAGIINPPGKYIFVNRNGAKVSEKSRFQVALDIKNKTIVLRDKNDIFDRALDRVLSDIRQRKPA